MAAKALFVFCASALFIQSITAQCSGNTVNAELNNIAIANGLGNGLAANYGPGLGLATLGGNGIATNVLSNGYGFSNGWVPSSGGAFTVTSYSPIAPTGISVVSENALDGSLAVSGSLPFLTAIGLEGQVPARGVAGVQYGCGNGNVGIVSETTAPAGYNGLAGPGLAAPSFVGAGLADPGLASLLAGLAYGSNLANTGLPLVNSGLSDPALNGPIARGANGALY